MPTPWGRLPVVSIPDLVELKKTNRPADYDVITRLAMIRVGRESRPSPLLLRWALGHVFRVEDILELLLRFGTRIARVESPEMEWIQRWEDLLRRGKRLTPSDLDVGARKLGVKAQRLQARGRRYWLLRIDELRRLRSEGRLLAEGLPVSRSIASDDAR